MADSSQTLADLQAVLVPAIAQLLREAEENPSIHPITFLAEYLMRHNPRHGIFKLPSSKDPDSDPLGLLAQSKEAFDACLTKMTMVSGKK